MRERSYWQDNLRLVGLCLVVWFTFSFGFGILLVDVLNQFTIGGFQLGFWFAQQGSIYVFVALIFFYAWRMSIVDARHGLTHDDDSDQSPDASGEESAGESHDRGGV